MMYKDPFLTWHSERQTAVDICDNCVIKQLQFQAGSPINDGFLLQSRYSSLTARCSKTGMPLGTSTTPFPVQWVLLIPTKISHLSDLLTHRPIPTSPAGNCTGHRYTLQAGDTCRSISKSQGVGTAWLLYDNNLAAFCAGFPTNGTLCIQNRCSVYTVQVNDTCLGIAGARNLSQIQLNTCKLSYNRRFYPEGYRQRSVFWCLRESHTRWFVPFHQSFYWRFDLRLSSRGTKLHSSNYYCSSNIRTIYHSRTRSNSTSTRYNGLLCTIPPDWKGWILQLVGR